jgi:hypothetical protein
MPLAFRPGSALRFRLLPGTFLYDCHAGEFASADGTDLIAGFIPFFHAALFGATPGAWHPYFTHHANTIAMLAPADRDAYIASIRPTRSLESAAKLAAFAFPGAARFLSFVTGPEGPFVLRPEFLFPENPPLGTLEGRAVDAPEWSPLIPEGTLATPTGRRMIGRMVARLAAGEQEDIGGDGDGVESAFLATAKASGLVAAFDRRVETLVPPPGVYLIGHSAILIRGVETGLLIAADAGFEPGRSVIDLVRSWCDVVGRSTSSLPRRSPSATRLAPVTRTCSSRASLARIGLQRPFLSRARRRA